MGSLEAGFTLVELVLVSVILGTLAALALPRLDRALFLGRVAGATGDLRAIELDLYDFWSDQERLPTSLSEIGRAGLRDPWGNPYVYVRINGGEAKIGGLRKDRFLVPLNSDFDLYSMGKDGLTAFPLSAARAKDDVVRANDGAFIGLASDY